MKFTVAVPDWALSSGGIGAAIGGAAGLGLSLWGGLVSSVLHFGGFGPGDSFGRAFGKAAVRLVPIGATVGAAIGLGVGAIMS